MNNETIPYVTRNLRHLLAAPNLTEAQRTIITRTLATLSELGTAYPEHHDIKPSIDDMLADDDDFMRKVDEASRKLSRPSIPKRDGIWRVVDGELTLNEHWHGINRGGR